ncbi:TPA: hypothetical protein CPT90_08590 [Candidatus Gastranaerophilales bacterium HUM_3]|nr:MAG TPA: hypothetical protein CPT90_08590 [Candidatus Gastranaerophilales bacterium HUM_3]DAB21718.1 MAG TPA: hypothetical protein CPT94_07010 [Candidatus Gastranaerophilales bacterium HUM_22]
MTQLEKQAQMMQSQASVFFRNQMGLGMDNQAFNPWNMSGGGITSFVLNQMGGMLASGQIPKDKDNKFPAMDQAKFQEMLQDYYTSGLGQYKDADGNPQEGKYGSNGQFTQDEVTAFKMAMQAAQQNQSQANMMCQQMSQNYQNNVSIWLEAAKEQLEAEQDAALAPLEMEQTDMELEKESVETQLAYAKERLQSIEQACSEETKNAAPKFGLG